MCAIAGENEIDVLFDNSVTLVRSSLQAGMYWHMTI